MWAQLQDPGESPPGYSSTYKVIYSPVISLWMCIAHTFAFMTFCVHCYQAEVMNVALICFHQMQGWIKFHHMVMVRNTALVFLACVFFFWKLAACINDVSWCIYRNQTFAESIYSNMSILASSLIDTNMKVWRVLAAGEEGGSVGGTLRGKEELLLLGFSAALLDFIWGGNLTRDLPLRSSAFRVFILDGSTQWNILSGCGLDDLPQIFSCTRDCQMWYDK